MPRARTCCVWIAAAVTTLSGPGPARTAGAAPATVNLFEDATGLVAQLRQAISGPILIKEISLYESHAALDVQDSRKKENVDRYKYEDGAFGKPVPVTMRGHYTQKDLDASVTPLEAIDFGLIPGMIQEVRKHYKLPDAKPELVTLKKGGPLHHEVRWHVVIRDERHTESDEFDLKGRVKR
jgi:hypothetical protein